MPWLAITGGFSGSGNGTVTYSVASNGGSSARTGTITVAGGGIIRTCVVAQLGLSPALIISPMATNVPADAASGGQIGVTANVSWTAATNVSWLTITGGGSGSGNGTVTYSVALNSATAGRTGTITVAGSGIVRTCTVAQAAAPPSLLISPTATNVPATASTGRQLSVAANVSWTASTNVPWLRITGGAAGVGNGTVTFGVSANDGTAGRTGTITVTGGGIVRICTVAQAGSPALNTYYLDADGDGYGNPGVSTTGAVPPFGYVGNGADCDDTRANVHPGASEVCGDGVDNDCDGQTDEGCAISTTYFSLDQRVACTGSGWSRTVVMDLTNYQDLAAQDGYQNYFVYYQLNYNVWTGIYVYDYDSGSFRAVTWMLNLNL